MTVRTDGRCYIVAEIGCNHCGNVETALRMVEAAADAGVDAVKLQLRDMSHPPESWATKPYSGPHSYGETYLEHRRALELSEREYRRIVELAHKLGIGCGASIWDTGSFARSWRICVDWLKAPSARLTDEELLDQLEFAAVHRDVHVVLSTGMSTEAEVAKALSRDWPVDRTTVLMCTASYPCGNEDVNLLRLKTLQDRFWSVARIGVSGHWCGIQIDAAAVAMGAVMVERHFTLNRTWKGTDHAASLEPAGLAKLVRDIRAVEDAMGTPELRVLECEKSAREKLRGAR